MGLKLCISHFRMIFHLACLIVETFFQLTHVFFPIRKFELFTVLINPSAFYTLKMRKENIKSVSEKYYYCERSANYFWRSCPLCKVPGLGIKNIDSNQGEEDFESDEPSLDFCTLADFTYTEYNYLCFYIRRYYFA